MEEVLHTMNEQDLGVFATDMKECMKCLRAAEAVVSAQAGSASAPQPSFRQLARIASDGHDAEAAKTERADVWKRTTAQRKKCVTLASVKTQKLRLRTAQQWPNSTHSRTFRARSGRNTASSWFLPIC